MGTFLTPLDQRANAGTDTVTLFCPAVGASVPVGARMLVFLASYEGRTITTPPAAFTFQDDRTNGDLIVSVYARTADGTENPGFDTYSWVFNAASPSNAMFGLLAIHDDVSAIDDIVLSALTLGTTTFDWPAVSTPGIGVDYLTYGAGTVTGGNFISDDARWAAIGGGIAGSRLQSYGWVQNEPTFGAATFGPIDGMLSSGNSTTDDTTIVAVSLRTVPPVKQLGAPLQILRTDGLGPSSGPPAIRSSRGDPSGLTIGRTP